MTSVLDDAKQTLNDIQQGLSNVGFSLLGLAAPLLAVRWTVGSDPIEPAGGGGLSLTATEPWASPAAGVLTVDGGADRILLPTGQAPAGASVLRLHPQVYLRLVRLYASFLEGRTDGLDLTVRPVPYFFVYSGATNPGQAASGAVKAGDPLKLAGTLTVHDRHGLPIDPVAVACVFDALLTAFPTLEPRAGLSTPATPAAGRQLNRIANFGAAGKRLRLADPHGQPHDGSQLQNLTPLAASVGLFSTTSTSITKATGAPPDLRLGPATNGLLGEAFTLPAAPAGAPTLRRDFYSVMVVDLKPFLIGSRPPDDPAAALEPLPEVRHQESVAFSLDGAMALGGANKILGQTPPLTDAFAVAPALRGDFTLPADSQEATAHWPAFPPGLVPATDTIPATLRDAFTPAARFISGSGSGADVALILNGLTAGQAVRVYNRVFLPDAREGRGDGAGAVVGGTAGSQGSVTLVLADPLGLVERGATPSLPTEATLHVDVVVVNSKGDARVFGNITAPIAPPGPAPAVTTGTNPFASPAIDRGTAPAGVLGLTGRPLPGVTDPLGLALALSGEGSPREAPRLPTMARRDAVVASASGTGAARTWKGQASGAHLVPGAINSLHRKGSPGSPGGRELQTVAVETGGGRLAYDLARAALRRTRHLLPRLILIENDRWAPPAAPAAAAGGTISGAVLQTVAAGAETPELTAFESQLTGPDFPQTWAQVVDKVFDKLPDMPTIPKPLPDFLTTSIKKIHDDLVNSPNHVRMYEEFKRDCSATFRGRRDALWALTRALGAARELIYIEGPAFSATGYGTPAVPTDLVETIRQRLRAAPGLRVVLCLSKELDYGPGYEMLAAREYAQRLAAVQRLQDEAGSRVVAFHPIGLPGRPLRLMTNVVVVDDLWALVGTSAFRRRGLTFDGGLDVSLFDGAIRDGRGAAIATLRRRLMAGHLGAAAPLPPGAGAPVPVPHPTWVRLADAHGAFSAAQDLLRQGGAGLIEPLWDGRVPGVEPIDPHVTAFPADAVADPDGRNVNAFVQLILAAFAGLATPPPPP
jgi:hypothetical protein